MALNLDEYLDRYRATQAVAGEMYRLFRDVGIPVGDLRDETEVLETEHAAAVMRAFEAASRFVPTDIIPAIPAVDDVDQRFLRPVMLSTDAAARLKGVLEEARAAKHPIDVSGAVEGFYRSVLEFMSVSMNGDAGQRVLEGASKLIPFAIDWDDREGSGELAEYLGVSHALVTYHTQQVIYLQQLAHKIGALKPSDVSDDLISDLRVAQAVTDEAVADLGAFFFDQYSIPRLHTERIHNALFDASRGHRVYVARLALNVSQMNDMDPDFASFVLYVMKGWLQGKKGIIRSGVQSSEWTSYQFIVEKPEDARTVFRNFDSSLLTAMNREFARRYPDRSNLDDKARRLLDNMNRFRPKGTVAVIPIDATNIVDAAIQRPEDVREFVEVLGVTNAPHGAIGGAVSSGFSEEGFALLKPWLSRVEIDIDRLRRWIYEGASEEENKVRKQKFQAFLLQGVFYRLKYLAGVVEFFEKERASLETVSVFFPEDVPVVGGDEHVRLKTYLDNDKYVSDGTFNPVMEYPALADPRYVAHLPHMRRILQNMLVPRTDAYSQTVKILNAWDRLSHEWGMLTHSPRPDNEGGAKEVMFAAINALDEAHRSGDPGAIEAALSNVRSAVAEFADIAIDVWARAMSDPKNPFFFKRESLGVTADGRSVNTNGIAQELARLGWTNMFGAEADSIQRFLIRYSMTFSPDFTDAAFQSVWGTILSVAVDWDMPVPLISRPGGDMVVVIPPKDLNGVDVDPAGFVFEVWSRVMSRYGDKPYPDVKKVMFNESEIVLGGGFDETAAREAFVSVADSMGLQAVPFMLHDKDDRYVLFTPEVNGWKDGEKVGVDAVVGALRAAGMPISSLRKSGRTVLKRVDIYESADGDGVRYRFSPFELGGGWSPFQKILSISTVLGTIPLMKNRGDVARYQRVIDEMGMPDGDIDNLKKRFFPRKAGFGAHASAALNCETADRECVAGIASLGSLVGFLDAGPIADIERAIGGPFPDDHARAVSRLSDLAAIYGRSAARQLAMAATRIAASNVALEKRIEDAGEALDGNAVGALMMMRDARREAAKHIGNISSGMRIIANTSMEYAVRGSAVDISPATIATSFVTQNIGFLRALMTGAGSGMFGQIALSPVRVTPIT